MVARDIEWSVDICDDFFEVGTNEESGFLFPALLSLSTIMTY